MKRNKPKLMSFIKAQNDLDYKDQGTIKSKNEIFIEKNYEMNKIIIDFILLLFCQTIMIIGYHYFYNVFNELYPINLWLNDNLYNSQLGQNLMQYYFLTIFFLAFWGFIITPIIIKCIRILLGLRWFFIKFKLFEKVNIKTSYMRLYNNYVSIDSSRIFYKKSSPDTNQEENKFIKKKFFILHTYYKSLIIFVFYNTFLIKLHWWAMPQNTIIIMLYLSILILYLLSHLFTYVFWKKISK